MRATLFKILQKHWSNLVKEAQEISFRKDQILFYEGHVPYGLFVVAKGSVHITTPESESLDGQSWISPQGLVLGIEAALEGRPSSCTIAASENSTLLFIPKSALLTYVKPERMARKA